MSAPQRRPPPGSGSAPVASHLHPSAAGLSPPAIPRGVISCCDIYTHRRRCQAPCYDRADDLEPPLGSRRRPARPRRWRRLRPELPALPADRLPTVDELFTFMRDAELRFDTLRMRIEERTEGVDGERWIALDVTLRHPGDAKVISTEPGPAPRSARTSSGSVTATPSGRTPRPTGSGTRRPVRRKVVGLDDRDLPGFSKVYEPLTALPMETLPETFVHPAGYCQNVLATGRCTITGTGRGRRSRVDPPRLRPPPGGRARRRSTRLPDRPTVERLSMRAVSGSSFPL